MPPRTRAAPHPSRPAAEPPGSRAAQDRAALRPSRPAAEPPGSRAALRPSSPATRDPSRPGAEPPFCRATLPPLPGEHSPTVPASPIPTACTASLSSPWLPLCDRADDLSLFDLTSGASPAPAADADPTVRSQWATRDAAARLAVRRHLPTSERAHFSQYKSAQTLYDAVVARYSSPATAALSRLMLPYLFLDLSTFPTVADLITHLRTSDTRYRAALPAEFCAKNPPPMYITLYYVVVRLPDSLRVVRDHFLAVCPTSLTVDLLEKALLAAEKSIVAVGASRGDPRTPIFEGCSPLLPPCFPLLPLLLLPTYLVSMLGGRSPVVLTGHADASWADDQATQRSSQGYTFSLGSGSVSWRSTRSSSVLGSSCEAEIYAGAMAAQELRWLTYLLTDLGEPPRSPPVLYEDNKAMLALCREQRLEHRTKHIALRYFLARELQQRGQLRLAYVASEANTADVFTKALAPCDHQRFCTQPGLLALLCLTGLVTPCSPHFAYGVHSFLFAYFHITYLLTDLGERPRSPPVLYVDNKAAIALCQEHRLEHRTKHIALCYFLARELQQRGHLRLTYVATRANTADIFTKALPPSDHQRFCTLLGLVPTLPHLL
ncbi:unnamed protein product [Closterium sp. NIES-53]